VAVSTPSDSEKKRILMCSEGCWHQELTNQASLTLPGTRETWSLLSLCKLAT
jgi:hypothetical protein